MNVNQKAGEENGGVQDKAPLLHVQNTVDHSGKQRRGSESYG